MKHQEGKQNEGHAKEKSNLVKERQSISVLINPDAVEFLTGGQGLSVGVWHGRPLLTNLHCVANIFFLYGIIN